MIRSLPLNLRESQCKELQKTAFNSLLGDQPTHVASFGNSDVNSVGDWVKILNTEPANEVAFDALLKPLSAAFNNRYFLIFSLARPFREMGSVRT